MNYSKSDLQLLSGPRGLIHLLSDDPPDFQKALRSLRYVSKLRKLQVELIKMQNWIVENNERLLVIFEGGEFAGKGDAIRAFTEHLNPRTQRSVALPKPTPIEAGQWYFQRYVMQLPQPGEIVLFDRSWYNRALVEPVNDFCNKKDYDQFMSEVNHFESMIRNDGIILIKLYFSVSKEVQAERIERVRQNPLRRWELTKVDEDAQKLWNKYKRYEKAMFKHTDTKEVPWLIIDGNNPFKAHINAIQQVLDVVPYTAKDS
ncbi:MAG: polyphosphate kinase 2 [Saprospiraceae bacterium]|nr:polyphosphate kinase 2 [Saprospiraceae bacterium]